MNNQIISDSIKQNINSMISKICNNYCAVEMLKSNKKIKRSIYNKIISKYYIFVIIIVIDNHFIKTHN